MVCSGKAHYYRFCDVPWQYTGTQKTAGTGVEALQSLRLSFPSFGADCTLSSTPLLAKNVLCETKVLCMTVCGIVCGISLVLVNCSNFKHGRRNRPALYQCVFNNSVCSGTLNLAASIRAVDSSTMYIASLAFQRRGRWEGVCCFRFYSLCIGVAFDKSYYYMSPASDELSVDHDTP